jgi:hypothetical protein
VAKLWDKFLVLRRDGTVPEWPYLVLGARDPAVPFAIRALADESERLGMDPAYADDLRALADDHDEWRLAHGEGDPDAARHRKDDPDVIKRITFGTVAFRSL